ELDCIRTIEELARVLRKHKGLRNVLPITTAKVPIVKFFHQRSGLNVDISLYNTLGLTIRLLFTYSAINPIVKCLCYMMKRFNKVCDIGDASRGSLSSYAYTLMVLYFLQQSSPPIIPMLQEPTYWPEYGENKESVGQLWLGLLKFYAEEFDFKEHIFSIRRKHLLTTSQKKWTSKFIMIKDPFYCSHKLGSGLSRKMTNFILKAFFNGRRIFGSPVNSSPEMSTVEMKDLASILFDQDVITEGELAPNDRCCRICGKIGHFMKDCPMRRKENFKIPLKKSSWEDTLNQRYTECREKKSKEVKDLQQEKILRTPAEKWNRRNDRDLREKRCFICGREGHIKKECLQFKGST
ncbi:terminal uridylyltransferase 7 isoform X2, partial [Sigmodon hispidus]